MVKVKEDLTGKKYGMLTVIKQTNDYIRPNGRHESNWLCQCECGNYIEVIIGNLNKTTSCGCYASKLTKERNKKLHYNIYDLSGEYGVGITSNTNKEFYFDLEDYDKIKNYTWAESFPSKNFSTLVTTDPTTMKTIKMHQLLGFKGYDHKNRNELDNRKCNLRPATQQENSYNKKKPANNTSGIIGVWWNKRNQNWCSEIKANKQKIFIGSFINKEDAIKARLEAEAKYFGEFAPQRHLFEEYGITIDKDEDLC